MGEKQMYFLRTLPLLIRLTNRSIIKGPNNYWSLSYYSTIILGVHNNKSAKVLGSQWQ